MAAIPTVVDTAGPTGSDEIHVAPSLPLTQKLKYGALAYGITKLIKTPLNLITAIKTDYLGSSPTNPDIIKALPSRPQLPIRVFLPKSHSSSSPSSHKKLPTLLTIHGGGFVLGSPYDNDGWNRRFVQLAEEAGHAFCVIALDYRKAPSYPFPTAIHDLEAVVLDLLTKSESLNHGLPIDLTRVAIAGWSAGGNLALAVSQLPGIKPLIKAVVPMYPVIDFVTPSETKATKSRRYKSALLGGFRGKETDFLMGFSGMFDWSYVCPGQKMGDPLLSPVYAVSVEESEESEEESEEAEGGKSKRVVVKGRQKFPANVFVIACELDMLGGEAWRLACKLAGKKVPRVEEKLGREEVGEKGKLELEDERFHWEVEVEDEQVKRRYRWLLVPDAIHGYDQDGVGRFGDEELVRDGMEKREAVMEIIRGWLMDGVL